MDIFTLKEILALDKLYVLIGILLVLNILLIT
jgi:hypothetical protein